ncbi:MAG: YceI family protein [Bacteroidetes bacterium]|nr:MAG: YceI family protein [Bacteroidota bacterium]REK04763.1 MAG: YceI family protein [Bacteroidota bacterium]REK36237.1 MAG: YceI family protein [Bacteroidota bacterium]REK51101.1 MAG: YceI family protein [Bacteroidota bacterium]
MKRSLAISIVFILTHSFAEAQNVFICKNGTASFFSSAPLEDIEALNNGVNSILNISNQEIAFIVPIRGFKFEKDLMQEHFNEKYMESDKFPQATFKGKILDTLNWSSAGIYNVSATGIMNIHGVEKEKTLKGKLEVKNQEFTIESSFKVAVAEFGISIPKLLFQNIADTVSVNVKAHYLPYKK